MFLNVLLFFVETLCSRSMISLGKEDFGLKRLWKNDKTQFFFSESQVLFTNQEWKPKNTKTKKLEGLSQLPKQ